MQENEQEANQAEALRSKLNMLRSRTNSELAPVKVKEILEFCNSLRELTQARANLGSATDSVALLLDAEELAFEVLPMHLENLPTQEEVNTVVSGAGDRRIVLFHQLKNKYPFAVRSVHNPHLYLPLLKRLEKVYGQPSHPVEEDWRHEVGHFSRYLAQPGAENFTPENDKETELVAIIHQSEGHLAFQPAIIQGQSKLTTKELISVINEVGDLSTGDRTELRRLMRQELANSFRQKVRSFFGSETRTTKI